MADNAGMGEALDWDDGEVSGEDAFVLLPAGVYAFGVEKLEKERFEGSAKMAPCPRAHLTLSVTGPGGSGTVHERLMLNTRMVWKIAQLFQSLGYRKNPETGNVPVAWNQIEGKGGYLLLKVREYEKKDGSKGRSNEVEEWLLPGDERIAQAAAAPAQAAIPVPPQPARTQHPGWSV